MHFHCCVCSRGSCANLIKDSEIEEMPSHLKLDSTEMLKAVDCACSKKNQHQMHRGICSGLATEWNSVQFVLVRAFQFIFIQELILSCNSAEPNGRTEPVLEPMNG